MMLDFQYPDKSWNTEGAECIEVHLFMEYMNECVGEGKYYLDLSAIIKVPKMGYKVGF